MKLKNYSTDAGIRKLLVLFSFLAITSLISSNAVTIDNAATTAGAWNAGTRTYTVSGTDNISATELAANLGTGNVTISVTSGDITLVAGNNITSTAGNTLTINSAGDITISANINLTGANGVTPPSSAGVQGSAGSNIGLTSTNGNITINGQITTSGGNGSNSLLNAREGGNGANAGTITISANDGLVEVNSPLVAIGGAGGNGMGQFPGSSGGNGNSISINASAVNINANLNTFGGTGFASGGGNNLGGAGGNGGGISVISKDDLIISGSATNINSAGGVGTTSGDRIGGNGGNGGSIILTSETGTVEIGNINAVNTSGGRGGNTGGSAGPTSYGGKGGNAGALSIHSYEDLIIGTITSGITANGGVGGNRTGGSAGGGAGGNGANLSFFSEEGEITIGSAINVSAGDKGEGQENNAGVAGNAGTTLIVAKNDIIIDGTITANGGSAGKSTQNSGANNLNEATAGGSVTISSSEENVIIKKTITANGGNGGVQNGHGRCGSGGAAGGSIVIEARKELNIQAPLIANGGNAAIRDENGGSDTTCQPGGNGGVIDLAAGDINVGANIQANGGKGGQSGGNGNDTAGIGGNGGNVYIEGNKSGSGSISTNGGNGGDNPTGGRCNYGGPSGNLVVNGTVTPGNSGNPAFGGGGCNPITPPNLCGTPVVKPQFLMDLLPPFCLSPAINTMLTLPTVNEATEIIWNGAPGTKGYLVEDAPGTGNMIMRANYTARPEGYEIDLTTMPNAVGRRVVFYATNGCGQTNFASAVITRSCPNDILSAAISGGGTICDPVTAVDIRITVTGGTAPYEVVYTDGTNNFTVTIPDNSPYIINLSVSENTTYTLVSAKEINSPYMEAEAENLTGEAKIYLCPIAELSGDATICQGEEAELTITITNGVAPFTVEFADGATLVINAAVYTFKVSPAVNTTYSLVSIKDSELINGKIIGNDVLVSVYPNDIIISEADGKTSVLPGGEITIHVSYTGNPLVWHLNNAAQAEPSWPLQLWQDMSIFVSTPDGNCPSNTVTVKTNWPNAIIRGGGVNGDFLVGSGLQMYVFNRFGITVYEGTGGWDGKYEGKFVDPDTYYYVIDLPDGSQRKATLKVVKEQ